jgi:hypothetical protein
MEQSVQLASLFLLGILMWCRNKVVRWRSLWWFREVQKRMMGQDLRRRKRKTRRLVFVAKNRVTL